MLKVGDRVWFSRDGKRYKATVAVCCAHDNASCRNLEVVKNNKIVKFSIGGDSNYEKCDICDCCSGGK
jgi:hypothetical protein